MSKPTLQQPILSSLAKPLSGKACGACHIQFITRDPRTILCGGCTAPISGSFAFLWQQVPMALDGYQDIDRDMSRAS